MQAIGLCRFSYPAYGGFQVEHDTLEARKAFLWADDRLEERFRLLECVALPCLKAQTDDDFDLIVVIGDDFPQQHKDRLHALVEDMPQVQIQAHAPEQQRPIMKRILQEARKYPDEPCLQFRYDDDDAVSVDFIEQLRFAVGESETLCSNNRTVAFDWCKGYVAEFGASGIEATQVYRSLYVASLGMYVRGGVKQTIMNFAHEKINRHMPTVTFGQDPMWVRSHNTYNDSRQKKVRPVPVEPLTKEERDLFALRFAISEDHVRQVFGGT
jgi:hypothetical protein